MTASLAMPPSHAAFPGRNGRILFSACDVFCNEDGSDSDIFSIRPDGTGRKRLSHNRTYDRFPSLSSDGRKVVFLCKGSIRRLGQICVMAPDGTDRVKLTSDDERNLKAPFWSPDGEQIAYIHEEDGDQLMVMNADGSNVRHLYTRQLGMNFPEWSPDGDSIIYTGLRAVGVLQFDVFSFDLSTGEETNITNSDEDEPWAACAPHGDRIITSVKREDGWDTLYSIAADGSDRHEIAPVVATGPAPSPDGTKLAFVHGRTSSLMVMGRDGANLQRLTRGLDVYGPDWQPR